MFTQSIGLDPGKILPTVGLNVGRIEAHTHNLVFWDLGGQSGLRSIWEKYYSEAHVSSRCDREALPPVPRRLPQPAFQRSPRPASPYGAPVPETSGRPASRLPSGTT